jgi:type III pantothenate kinase
MPAWVACSVVPRLDRLLREAAMRYCGCEALFVPGEIPLPLANRYQRPEEVGADRLVTAYAASRTVDAPGCLVIDFGTATTFDLVAGGEYLGGLICPGVLTSARALSSGTAKLPQAELRVETDQAEPGLSTATSLSHGLVFGFAAMAEGLAARLLPRLPEGSAVVATGGLAPHIARVCRAIHLVRPHLLLEGLELAYTDNSLFQPAKGA